jgi:hypothetical protein
MKLWGGTSFGCFLSAVFLMKTGVTGHHFENTDLIKQKRQMVQLNLQQNWPRDFHWLKKRMH